MNKNHPYRTGSHCVFMLHAHLVFVTKYRCRVFRAEHLESLEGIFRNVCADFENALWSLSYFTGSVGGAPISIVRQYIEQQARPH
ncbi:transposase [Halomonas sp. ISL-60]|uniref:transposase n=1 Tax=Halomonas sp. ISL-56 TaxID=2819149 RepID=UPI001BED1B7D|nr:transposase [Halomonas sp. ISL-56]MBT2774428.1 transposase [Halomonas sp. ISL-60]MBT2802375.1 transposase [Halomonas sp. ISL-56]